MATIKNEKLTNLLQICNALKDCRSHMSRIETDLLYVDNMDEESLDRKMNLKHILDSQFIEFCLGGIEEIMDAEGPCLSAGLKVDDKRLLNVLFLILANSDIKHPVLKQIEKLVIADMESR
jgi:hypothetical protein